MLDGAGINGIAPKVNLVALKISQWCGSAYDSEILAAFVYAADHGINIVSISFGGYLNKSNPDEALILKQYEQVVKYANKKGTTIVAAAGNEHVRVNGNGKVVTHGPLTAPGTAPADFGDLFGLYEVPGGIKGVVDVAATGNVVNASSASCPRAAGERHQLRRASRPPIRTSRPGWASQNQLAYYSNYGPRIDVAAPGGARKFNLPVWDRGGTPGFPYTSADGTNAWETFSITSNWALRDPLLRAQRRRLPGQPVLQHHPGDIDGDPARVGGAGPDRQRQAEPRAQPGWAGQAAHEDGDARPRATPRPGCRPPTCPVATRPVGRAPRATATSVDPPSLTRRRTAPAS